MAGARSAAGSLVRSARARSAPPAKRVPSGSCGSVCRLGRSAIPVIVRTNGPLSPGRFDEGFPAEALVSEFAIGRRTEARPAPSTRSLRRLPGQARAPRRLRDWRGARARSDHPRPRAATFRLWLVRSLWPAREVPVEARRRRRLHRDRRHEPSVAIESAQCRTFASAETKARRGVSREQPWRMTRN